MRFKKNELVKITKSQNHTDNPRATQEGDVFYGHLAENIVKDKIVVLDNGAGTWNFYSTPVVDVGEDWFKTKNSTYKVEKFVL